MFVHCAPRDKAPGKTFVDFSIEKKKCPILSHFLQNKNSQKHRKSAKG